MGRAMGGIHVGKHVLKPTVLYYLTMQISDALVPSKIYFMTLPVTRHRVLSERGFLAAAYRIPGAMAHQRGLAAS